MSLTISMEMNLTINATQQVLFLDFNQSLLKDLALESITYQLYSPKGRVSFRVDRVRFNDDYFIDNFAGQSVLPNDGSFLVGLDYLRFVKNFSPEASISRTNRRNRYYEADRDVKNVSMSLKVGYLFKQSAVISTIKDFFIIRKCDFVTPACKSFTFATYEYKR